MVSSAVRGVAALALGFLMAGVFVPAYASVHLSAPEPLFAEGQSEVLMEDGEISAPGPLQPEVAVDVPADQGPPAPDLSVKPQLPPIGDGVTHATAPSHPLPVVQPQAAREPAGSDRAVASAGILPSSDDVTAAEVSPDDLLVSAAPVVTAEAEDASPVGSSGAALTEADGLHLGETDASAAPATHFDLGSDSDGELCTGSTGIRLPLIGAGALGLGGLLLLAVRSRR